MYKHGDVKPKVFLYHGMKIARKKNVSMKKASKSHETCFRSHFGTSSDIVAEIWFRLEKKLVSSAYPWHLLWALLFMKVYATEPVLCSMCGGIDPKTLRKWTRYFTGMIAERLFPKEVSSKISFVFSLLCYCISQAIKRLIGKIDCVEIMEV